ncbi:formate dehydrogenase subunit delta [Kribbella sp. GL6]|uniref:formate dehydrogenase subunit delta n=1 Tax=Kribbella sp. GL6 TaxID=3419765 RepID=UPI003CFC6D73
MSTPPALRLAGDIAAQFQHLPADEAAERVAHHLKLFWDPRMLAQLRSLAGADCDPVIARAVTLLAAS